MKSKPEHHPETLELNSARRDRKRESWGRRRALKRAIPPTAEVFETRLLMAGNIQGTVFRDYNSTGTQDGTEPGVAGVTVQAFDDSNANVGSAVTDSAGHYDLTVSGTTTRVRIAFALPAGFETGPVGAGSKSSIQFADTGGGTVTGFSLGLRKQGDASQSNPLVVTSLMRFGDQATGPNNTQSVLVAYPYNSSGEATPATVVATASQLSSIFGLAYDYNSKNIYTSAYVRANNNTTSTALKLDGTAATAGPGAVYRVDVNNLGAPVIRELANLSAGTDTRTSAFNFSRDNFGFVNVGKMGLGGLEVSPDGTRLYVMNMFDKSLYVLNAADGSVLATVPVPDPTGRGANRPMAVKYHEGTVYIGMVDSGENGGTTSDLRAFVYTFDTTALTFGATPVLQAPLNYARGAVYQTIPGAWRTWNDTFSNSVGLGSNPVERGMPQPMFSDIEFDNGAMVIALRDRFGDQLGFRVNDPQSVSTTLHAGDSAGDLLRAESNGSGGWTLENNASSGGVTTAGAGNKQGPGGGEYYNEDFWSLDLVNDGVVHQEVATGGLLQVPGLDNVLTTVFDPTTSFFAGGVRRFFNVGANAGRSTTGAVPPNAATVIQGYQLYRTTAASTTFAKGNGLGDLEALFVAPPNEIGDRVWLDLDGDGLQDASEPGIAGVTVNLYQNNVLVGAAITDANGLYIFGGAGHVNMLGGNTLLPSTSYEIRLDNASDFLVGGLVPGGYLTIPTAPGTTTEDDSNASLVAGVRTVSVTTGAAGSFDHSYDIGFVPAASLAGQVYEDSNNDGSPLGEAPIPGATVTLKDNAGNVVATTTTDANGNYKFSNLQPGTYGVFETQPAGYLDGKDTAGTNGGDAVSVNDAISGIVLNAGNNATDYNFGELLPASISGFVYSDSNNDGSRAGEAPIPGATVTLKDGAGNVVATTTTDANGAYAFTNLLPGTYAVFETQPAGFLDGKDSAGSKGGDSTSLNDVISAIVLNAGDSATEYNFGELAPASISGFVYSDSNNDGNRAGEAPIPGATVTLKDGAGNVVATTTTDATGAYAFTNLLPGSYSVFETQPAGFNDGKDSAGNKGGDAVSVNDVISGIVLNAGDNAVEYNFGELAPASIAGFVYSDSNNDGDRTGEAPIPGATVTLKDGAGNVVATTTTDANGAYSFTNLLPGSYSVFETQPVGFFDGKDSAGSKGGDAVSVNDVISGIVLNAGDSATEYNFGEIAPASISGFVFSDSNNDGDRTGEAPIPGATVTLKDGLGIVVATTTTDVNGAYSFTNLLPGAYTVFETQPAGFLDGKDSAGSKGGDAASVNDVISAIVLNAGDDGVEYNFGELAPASIAGFVYSDSNNDGDRTGEAPIPGATVTLKDGLGNVVATTTTDANGAYSFTNLLPGTYAVFETQPAGFLDGKDSAGNKGGDAVSVNDVISAIVLNAGDNAVEYNFGELAPASISGFVYSDSNNDGDRTGEAAIPGATVVLKDSLGNIVGTTTTDANGAYTFTNLLPGTYAAFETQPAGFLDGQDTAGTNGGDAVSVNDVVSGIVLNAGDNATEYNFGELLPASISGFVYSDSNNDGDRAGEAPILGATITLKDSLGNVVATTTTDANGAYSFTKLLPGTYAVFETQPAGFLDGKESAGSKGGDAISINDVISGIVLNAGDNGVEYNFGELAPASISGFVYSDSNNDGDRTGEAPIPGATVTLKDGAGNVVATTTTDANGAYAFSNLLPGAYAVFETQPAGFLDGKDSAGSKGGDATSVNDAISNVALNAGDSAVEYNFGELAPASIAGFVYADSNNDGDRTGEAPIPGATVTLKDGAGNVVATTTTDANGAYSFTNLLPGTYGVFETQPLGFLDGKDSVGNKGGDATSVNDVISAIVLNAGDSATEYNFGELAPASISGFVYSDSNNDGDRTGEAPIPGATVTLKDGAGNVVATTTTDANGAYSFTNLLPGSYSVFETQPVGFFDGKDSAGSKGGDAVSVNDVISAIVLNAGDNATEYNFGELSPASISGFVYVDSNNDGDRTGETPIPGATVTLKDGAGNVVATTTTDANGAYAFTNLLPGAYAVFETQPAGFLDGKDSAGSKGGDAISVNDVISGVVLNAGDAGVEYNFGELVPSPQLASLSGQVYSDSNNDGTPQPGEPGLPGVTITLKDSAGNVVATTVTDASGNYVFTSLPPGTYTVVETQPGGLLDGKESAGSNGGDATSVNDVISGVVLNAGDVATNYNFGELAPASISGFVYSDSNNDGSRAGETPIPGATVTLKDGAGNVVATTTTDATGAYVFTNLLPGTYGVFETQPAGFLDGKDSAGSNGGDAISVNDVISGVVLNAGDNGVEYNFGELAPASISGLVYSDSDNDGAPQPGEPGLPGVTVTLKDGLGNVVATTTTDANGAYSFTNLLPGSYAVFETQPVGFNDGKDSAGNKGGDAISVNDVISGIVLNAGDAGVEYNFGELVPSPQLASLSGQVYSDSNNDGTPQPGEPGLPGVTITLKDSAGNVVATTVTDANGNYVFTSLPPGTYAVFETQPAGFLDGKENAGSNGGDAVSVNDAISTIVLNAGDVATNYNFGELAPASISGFVYSDSNNDGDRTGEAPIPGATVTLKDSAGNVVATTTADVNGAYLFTNLLPGSYSVFETQPVGFFDGKDSAGNKGGDAVSVNDAISAIVLNAGDDGVEYNFGELAPASISGFVYSDSNNDGVIQAGEPGLPGATVVLKDGAGNVVATTTTDANGAYSFTNLPPGAYGVFETQPSGVLDGKDSAGSKGGDAVSVNDAISGIVLNPGDSATDYNFGELAPASISGFVYVDSNNDGDRTGETPIPGATVTLKDGAGNVVATTTTDANGAYSFTNLLPGTYAVFETQPAGFNDGKDSAGSKGGDAISVNDVISGVVLNAGDAGVEYNFGELVPSPQLASLSGQVYSDSNNDGTPQPGEPGLPGVTITLKDSAGNVVATTVTDANGNYVFNNVTPGTYTVVETQPAGVLDGKESAGSNGGDATSVNDVISGVVLNPGDNATGYNFGELPPASISGFVYSDSNNDGSRVGEAPIPGATVTLKDGAGNVVATTTTDANGAYAFTNLLPGSYSVFETQPVGFFDGKDSVGNKGGDAVSVNDAITNVVLNAGDAGIEYNFGELAPASITGFVYSDSNNDGVAQPGEPGLPGVTVVLKDGAGNVVATTTTDANGAYSFSNLSPGSYSVFETQPAGFLDGKDSAGNKGGDAVSVNDVISAIVLNAGDNATEYNFGELSPASISGFVYVDSNNDGDRTGETPIPGATVTLKDGAGNVVATTTTDANGAYSFTNLLPGTYAVFETQPAGFNDGKDSAGNKGGDAISVNDVISGIVLNAGDAGVEYNFGELVPSPQLASLSGQVYSDSNNDGTPQPGEPGLSGVTVTLKDGAGNVVATTTTDANGNYVFNNVTPGTYTVVETQPGGVLDGKDAAGSNGGDATSVNDVISGVVLNPGDNATGYNFGELAPASIAGFVYSDSNNDGSRASEAPIPGATVTLKDGAGNVVATTTTDANGAYSFTNLLPGTYGVFETQPAGFLDGKDSAGSKGGDAISVNDVISGIVLNVGDNGVEYNFGELAPASIAGFVYSDSNNDGVIQAGEPGLPGATVVLKDGAGNVVATTTTDANGAYVFNNLLPGTYAVFETQPAGFLDGKDSAGSKGGDATSVNDVISVIVLNPGDSATAYNFGELAPASISGFVYSDSNNDGDGTGEAPIPGATVTLKDSLGNVVATTTTDANGSYNFTNLLPGTYAVFETQPAGFLDGKDSAGSKGGDATSVNDVISGVVLNPGDNATGYNFGELAPASISGFVYSDSNNDGSRVGEAPIPGATVALKDGAGNVVATTTTDANGAYLFTNLLPGTYSVFETQPAGFLDGKDSAGSKGGDATSVNDVISNVALNVGDSAVEYNFGELTRSSVAGIVSQDLNNDGVVQPGEQGVPGVTVVLTGTDDLGNPVNLTTTTGPDGTFVFGDLRPGTYGLTETQPPGLLDGKDAAGPSGGTVANDVISNIVVGPGGSATGNVFNELPPASISGQVFQDPNNDGVRQAGEAGIPAVMVSLSGTDDLGNPVLLVTTTDANGQYSFGDLRPGTYSVSETQPPVFLDGKDRVGSLGGANSSNDAISGVTIGAGASGVNYDFAELMPAQISGAVYKDVNNDGVRQPAEVGIPNVTVVLTGKDDLGNPIGLTTTTDANGSYTFGNLRPGTYSVAETQPAGFIDGKETAGSNGGDATSVNDVISAIPLNSGDSASGYDFGETLASSLGGKVFIDFNANGRQDVSELGIPNVTLTLTQTSGLGSPQTFTAVTGRDGSYQFVNLPPGTYVLHESQPNGFLDGKNSPGTLGGVNSGVDTISEIVIGSTQTGRNYLFPEYIGSQVRGTVYVDANGDGKLQTGEQRLAGVQITLTGVDDLGAAVNQTTTTNAAGDYRFSNLRPGTYAVAEAQPSEFDDGKERAGSQGGDVSVNDKISGIVLGTAEDAFGYLFGERDREISVRPSSISGKVFVDANGDKIQNGGEISVGGTKITLNGTDDQGNVVNRTTTTDALGSFLFGNLRPGTYSLTQTQPLNLLQGESLLGSEGGVSASPDSIVGIVLSNSVSATGYAFTERTATPTPPQEGASFSGHVFIDGNDDAIFNEGETGVPNVQVVLSGVDAGSVQFQSRAVLTNADGLFQFTGLAAGRYSVRIVTPSGFVSNSASPGAAGGVVVSTRQISQVQVNANGSVSGYDFSVSPAPAVVSRTLLAASAAADLSAAPTRPSARKLGGIRG